MPDKRQHRGQNPRDAELFAADELPNLRQAVTDYSWLLTRQYPEKSALKLVGDRFRLKARQRFAVQRCGCADQVAELIQANAVAASQLDGQLVLIDGFNLLILIESALSGGFLLKGRDGCFRDLASVHSTYRQVVETQEAIKLIGNHLQILNAKYCIWYLDRPVSNSGRLRSLLLEIAEQQQWNWEVELEYNPDKVLQEAAGIVVSSDNIILQNVERWFNLPNHILENAVPEALCLRL